MKKFFVFLFISAITLAANAQFKVAVKGELYRSGAGNNHMPCRTKMSSSNYAALKVNYDFLKCKKHAFEAFVEYGGAYFKYSENVYNQELPWGGLYQHFHTPKKTYRLLKLGVEYAFFFTPAIYMGAGLEQVLLAMDGRSSNRLGWLAKVGYQHTSGAFLEFGLESVTFYRHNVRTFACGNYYKRDFSIELPGAFLSLGYKF